MTTYETNARAVRELIRPSLAETLRQLARAKGARRDLLQRVVWRRLREAARET